MLTISDIAAKHLETWLDDLMWGRLQLWQLPSPVRGFFDLGFHEGTQISTSALTEKIERLESECDRLYLAAFTPKERREELLKRHQERDHFEWELFENQLINIIRSSEDAHPRAEVELTDGTTQRARKAA